MLRRTLVAGLAGVVLSLAYAPVGIPYVMPVALAAFALVTRVPRLRAGFWLGLVFGAGFYFPHIWWMGSSIGYDAWAALAGIEAAFYGLLGLVAVRLHRLRAWPFWLAAAWAAMETLRSGWPFSGMPWGRLGFGVVDTPLGPALAWVGITGVGFVVAALGFLLARLVAAAPGERLLAGAGLVVVAAVAVTPVVLPYELPQRGDVRVAAVQGDVPGRGNDILADYRQVTENQVEATEQLAADVRSGAEPAPDFVLWPENSTAVDPFADAATGEQIERAVSAIGVPLLVGAIVDAGPDHVLNQGIVWDPDTGAGQRYTKHHPVPYGEYIPYRTYLSGLFGRLDRIPRDMLSGTRRSPLEVAGVPVADSICFDIAYDDAIADQVEGGAQLLTVQTSNASFVFTDQLEQQFQITRARAVESGKYVVVASTNGISGVIAPDGSVVARTERRTRAVVTADVGLRDGVTPGTRIGVAAGPLAGGATLLGVALSLLPRRRRRPAPEPERAAPPEAVREPV